MTVAAFLLIVAAVVFLVWLIRKTVQEAVARMEAQVLKRQLALDKQAKVHVRNQARALRASLKLADQSRGLHDSIQHVLCDPRIQRALDEGVSANGR